ncbi:MAG: hypothetical protein HY722_11855 [Planctomycetes bacterium]|nr:hypothetical protein [Planctomycetota bacterium]
MVVKPSLGPRAVPAAPAVEGRPFGWPERRSPPGQRHPEAACDGAVHLSPAFLDRWVHALDEGALRTYLALAAAYDPGLKVAQVPEAVPRTSGVGFRRLIRDGLVEPIPRGGATRTLMLHVDGAGVHRPERCQPTVAEALDAHRRMVEELCSLSNQDDTPNLRERCFRRYPELREEYAFHLARRRPETPPWRLWMELSMYLVGRFEERHGHIKRERPELFKESSAEVVRIHLEVVERVVQDLLARREEVFPRHGAPGEPWVEDIAEEDFVGLDFVQEVSRRYRLGPEQIYLDLREALLNSGTALVRVDARGVLRDVELPTAPGLDRRTERTALTRPKDLDRRGIQGTHRRRAVARVGRARRDYVRAYLGIAAGVLASFRGRRKVEGLAATAERLVRTVNDATEFLREDRFGVDLDAAPPRVEAAELVAAARKAHRSGGRRA